VSGAATVSPSAQPPLSNRIAMAVGRPICHFIFTVLYRVRVEGFENIPVSGPVIIIANHQSYFDAIIVGLLARNRHFRAIARSGLFNFRPLGWLMNLYGAISLDQSKGDLASFRLAIEEINKGRALIIHPEGGRTRSGRTEPFQRGFHLVLKRTNAVIVPVAIEGAYDVWPAGRRSPRWFGRLAVRALPPLSPEALRHADHGDVLPWLRRMIERERLTMRGDMRARSEGRYPIERQGDLGFWETPEGGS